MKKLLLGLAVVALIAIDITYSVSHAEEVTLESYETDGTRYAGLEVQHIWVLIFEENNQGEK